MQYDYVFNNIYERAKLYGAYEENAYKAAEEGLEIYKKNTFTGSAQELIEEQAMKAVGEEKC